jgi:hypothetical protein
MGCLHLEGAVIRPQIDRIGDACTSSLIDLFVVSYVTDNIEGTLTISADSGPAMLNSISAYFFQ